MKLRILSDLHLDINDNVPFSLANKDVFTIICGDISGNPRQTIEWINNNIKQGVFIEGNHIGYDSEHSIQYIENFLCKHFPATAQITYLKDTHKIVDDSHFYSRRHRHNWPRCFMHNVAKPVITAFRTANLCTFHKHNLLNRAFRRQTVHNFF